MRLLAIVNYRWACLGMRAPLSMTQTVRMGGWRCAGRARRLAKGLVRSHAVFRSRLNNPLNQVHRDGEGRIVKTQASTDDSQTPRIGRTDPLCSHNLREALRAVTRRGRLQVASSSAGSGSDSEEEEDEEEDDGRREAMKRMVLDRLGLTLVYTCACP